jgi:hypothetical protein
VNMSPQPHDIVGWTIVAGGAVVTLWAIGFAVWATLRPGEEDPRHPKRLILKDDR